MSLVVLLDHLRSLGLSNRDAREAMRSGKVRLGGIPTADAGREVDPAALVVDPNAPRLVVGRDPVLVWRDPALAVIWKPAGLLSVPAPGRERDPSVLAIAGRLLGRALAVHRLDEETSGLMLVARTEAAQRATKALFEAHDVERRYLALVQGALRGERTVRSELVRDRGDGRRGSGSAPDGRPAVTHLRALESLRAATLVEARLETGRTHQVRIHLSEAGHPLLGDRLYAPQQVARRARRVALHAATLGFVHPETREPLRFEAPLADDLEALRRDLAR